MATRTAAPEWQGNGDAMNRRLIDNWGWLLLRGILAVLFGILTFLMPIVALRSLVLLFSAYMLVDGVVGIVAAVRAAQARERWRWLVLEGVLNILAGAAAFLLPTLAVLSFVLLASAWAIISGAALLVASFRLHPTHGRWLMLLAALASIAWGVLLFLAPAAGAVVLTLWFGAYALVFGLLLIFLAVRLRSRRAHAIGGNAQRFHL